MSTMADKIDTVDTTAPTSTVPVTAEQPKLDAPAAEPLSTQPETADAAAPVEEKTPINDGVLGYKAPGLLKSLRFAKKYFWFGEEAVPAKDLQAYLRDEKAEIAHHNAAWSSHTGKGLLYMAKSAEQKATPAGIINLADVSDLTKDGVYELHFKLHGQKHSFQAASMPERDGWFARIESAATDAKAQADEVKNSTGYKENMEQFGKLAVSATTPAVTPRKSSDKVPTAAKTDASSSDSSRAEDKEKKAKDRRSRSASRKRTSLFGSLLGRKEEHDEKKSESAEAKPEVPAIKPLETETTTEAETAPKVDEIKPAGTSLDPEAVASRVVTAPVIPVTEDKPAPIAKDGDAPATEAPKATEPVTPAASKEAPKPSKRNSLFGTFFQRRETASPSEEKKEHDLVPAVPAKDSEISATAPTLPETANVTEDKPSEPIATSPAPATSEVSKEKPASAPKEGFFGRFLRQDKAKTPETKTEDDAKVEPQPAAAVEPTKEAAPVASSTETPNGSAKPEEAIVDQAKDKKRPSFFNTLSSRKEKKAEVAPEGEAADAEGKKAGNSSTMPKFSGLFRKPSRGAKALFDQKKESAPATTDSKSTEPETATAPLEGTTVEPATTSEATPTAPTTSTVDEIAPVATSQPSTKAAPEVQAAA